MRFCFFLISFFIAANSFAANGSPWPISDYPRFWILGEGNSHFSLDTMYFFTKENYDNQGIVNQPSTMENVRYGRARFHGAFGLTPKISLYAQADLRGLFALNSRGSNISDDDNYGFGDAMLAGRWLVYRSRSSNRIYPTEWSPDTYAIIAEGSWVFPMYDRAMNGKPPLGNHSNDLTGMARAVWYINEWIAASGGLGYTQRTAGYAPEIPWTLRGDFIATKSQRWRLWAELYSSEAMSTKQNVFNPKEPDIIPGNSYLFKTEAPTLRTATIGVAHLISTKWEASLAGYLTTSGINAGKGSGGVLGLAWRPYQVPEIKYEAYRQEQRKRAEKETVESKKKVLRYDYAATILKVSIRGNYFKIGFGSEEDVKVGDSFQVFEPNNFTNEERKPLALATVVAVKPHNSFLRVESDSETKTKILPGFEARRVVFEE